MFLTSFFLSPQANIRSGICDSRDLDNNLCNWNFTTHAVVVVVPVGAVVVFAAGAACEEPICR